MTHPALNVLGQQIGWFAVVRGAAHGHPFLGAGAGLLITVLHLAGTPDRAGELRLLALATGLGLLVESCLQTAGLLTYASRWPALPWLCPPWILVLWIQFATTLRHGLRWLLPRRSLAVALGAAGGPMAFRAGEALGAVRFAPERWHSLAALSLVWAIAMPILTGVARRLDQAAGRGGRGKNELVRAM